MFYIKLFVCLFLSQSVSPSILFFVFLLQMSLVLLLNINFQTSSCFPEIRDLLLVLL